MNPNILLTDVAPKIINYKLARRGIVQPAAPINLTLSVTNVCQSRCKTCSIWALYNVDCSGDPARKKDELMPDEIEKFFRSLGHVYFVNISGGEPYLRPDLPRLIEMADVLLTPSVIHIPTNALLPDKIQTATEDILQRLEANGRGATLTVKPSFDGIGEMHDAIRGAPGNFDRLLDTLKRLRDLRRQYGNLEVGLGTVISVFNINHVEQIAAFAHEQGVDSYISEIAEQRSEMFNTEQTITPPVDLYEQAINKFAALSRKNWGKAGRLGRTTQAFRLVYYQLVIETMRRRRQALPCYGGISNVHISPYGDVWPCCVLGYDKSMGNLRDTDFDFWRIWRSERAAEARRTIAKGECWCPLANQAYSNILCSPSALARVAMAMARK